MSEASTATHRILIAGVGNIFLGDDAFGVEVAQALLRRPRTANVSVVDFGIRGYDLAYALLGTEDAHFDSVILVDALPRGETPGTLYTIEPDLLALADQVGDLSLNGHGLDPVKVLRLAMSMGEVKSRVYVVGCEPGDFGDELEGRMGLSAAVQPSVAEAVQMIEELVNKIVSAKAACFV
ncbi:MAG: hydrogenase maturation protease [Acidobacteriaceae bacterium]